VAFAGNDYLQLLAELGLLGAPLFIALFVTAHRRALRTATSGADWNLELLGLGCTGAIAAIGVHSLVDFTARIPANALTLAWIAGLAASGPSSASAPGPMATVWRKQTIALACALVLLAPARLALASALRDNPGLERGLCRVGICSSDAPAVRGSGIVPRVDASLEALVRNPAEPSAWCDLGDAMLASGRVDEARLSFANALEVGPRKPIVHYRMASFHFELGETRPALAQAALALGETTDFDSRIFAMYIERRMPAASVLAHGLPPGPRPVQRYLRALIAADRPDEAAAVWEWALSMHDADDALARDYVHFRFRRQEYAQAARSWGQYVGDRTTGYLESSWIYDGGFEQAPAHTDFDWKLENLADSVIASIDPNVARSGKQSLKIRFAGDDNVDYHHTSQVVFVEPGVYRFSAQVRAMNVTTDQGLAFHLFDPHEPRQVDVWSPAVMATTGWTTLEQTVTVPANVPLLIVEIARQKSSRLDSHIAGTVWIDDVALSRIEQ
jgi:tetratricopeptide (TPR) repeat protein